MVAIYSISQYSVSQQIAPRKQNAHPRSAAISLFLEKPQVKQAKDQKPIQPKQTTTKTTNGKTMSGRIAKRNPSPAVIVQEEPNNDKKMIDDSDPTKIEETPSAKQQRASPRDWNAIAKQFVREEFENKRSKKQRQKKLWMKAPSILYGSPSDFADGKEKKVALKSKEELKLEKLLSLKERKFKGFGISFGKSCFLGFKAVDKDRLEAGRSVSSKHMINCDF